MEGNWPKQTVWCSVLLAVSLVPSMAAETLYNGIELPEPWPPQIDKLTREPMPVPYLENRPEVVPIDIGRQLFVDDFLIERTTLRRSYHRPEYHPDNPILKPDKPWERGDSALAAAPFPQARQAVGARRQRAGRGAL